MNPPFGFSGDSDESPIDWLFEEKPELNQKSKNFRLLYQPSSADNPPDESGKLKSGGVFFFAVLFAWLIVSSIQSFLILGILLIAGTQDWLTVPPFWVVFSVVLAFQSLRVVDRLLFR